MVAVVSWSLGHASTVGIVYVFYNINLFFGINIYAGIKLKSSLGPIVVHRHRRRRQTSAGGRCDVCVPIRYEKEWHAKSASHSYSTL
jgi:hypothetical protein